jgi:hypothetical protein
MFENELGTSIGNCRCHRRNVKMSSKERIVDRSQITLRILRNKIVRAIGLSLSHVHEERR